MTDPFSIGELINKHALAHSLRPDIIAAIIIQESNGSTFSNRFEPGFYDRYIAHRDRSELGGWVPEPGSIPTLVTEKYNRAFSWGLMQVMGNTARELGQSTAPYLTSLCDPDRGIDVGCRVFAHYLGREDGNYKRALARYNAGSVTTTGLTYAEKVLSRIEKGEHLRFFQGG